MYMKKNILTIVFVELFRSLALAAVVHFTLPLLGAPGWLIHAIHALELVHFIWSIVRRRTRV